MNRQKTIRVAVAVAALAGLAGCYDDTEMDAQAHIAGCAAKGGVSVVPITDARTVTGYQGALRRMKCIWVDSATRVYLSGDH